MPANIKPLPEIDQDDIDRFWSYVDKNPPPGSAGRDGDCWIWTGAKSNRGYGVMVLYPPVKTVRVSRVAHFIQHGEDPFPYLVLHSCDNPTCVRGSHIRKGTDQDNSNDAVARNRRPMGDKNPSRMYPELLMRGETHHNAKLTDAQILKAFEMSRAGTTATAIAAHFGASISCICRYLKGEVRGMVDKGTAPKSLIRRGDNHHGTKATKPIRIAIRADKAAGMSYAQLRAKYGLTNCPLWKIVKSEEEP